MAQTKKQKMLAEKLGDNQAVHGFDDALKLPSFQLNVRNQGVNKMLMFLVASQLVTNIGLIATLWYKLG